MKTYQKYFYSFVAVSVVSIIIGISPTIYRVYFWRIEEQDLIVYERIRVLLINNSKYEIGKYEIDISELSNSNNWNTLCILPSAYGNDHNEFVNIIQKHIGVEINKTKAKNWVKRDPDVIFDTFFFINKNEIIDVQAIPVKFSKDSVDVHYEFAFKINKNRDICFNKDNAYLSFEIMSDKNSLHKILYSIYERN